MSKHVAYSLALLERTHLDRCVRCGAGLEPRVVTDHVSKRGKAPSGDARGLEEVNYFLTISLKIGTEFQPKATSETPSLWPPVAPWYQSGIDGMSSRRIS